MATQTIEFRGPTGQTITLRLFVPGSDTLIASASSTEATNRKGTYLASFTDIPVGEYQCIATIGTSPIIPVASGFVTLEDLTATFRAYSKVELITKPPTIPDIVDGVHEADTRDYDDIPGSIGWEFKKLRQANPFVEFEITDDITPTDTEFAVLITDFHDNGSFQDSVLCFTEGDLTYDNNPILSLVKHAGYSVITLQKPMRVAPEVGDRGIINPLSHVYSIEETQDGLALEATSQSILTAIGEIDVDFSPILNRLPEELEDGRMKAVLSETQMNLLASNAIDELIDGISFTEEAFANMPAKVVLPLSGYAPDRGNDVSLKVYYGEKITQILFAYEADGTTPVDLSGKTLEIIVERYSGDDVDIIPNEDITVTGEDGNEVRFNYTHAISMLLGTRNWALRDADDTETVYLKGTIEVLKAARNNAHNS